MDTTLKILCHLFSFDLLKNASPMVVALAHRSIRFGFDSLSVEQKLILKPFLSVKCSGYDDVDGAHQCSKVLEGEDLFGGLWSIGRVLVHSMSSLSRSNEVHCLLRFGE